MRHEDHWSEVCAKTETQRVKRTETRSLARMDLEESNRCPDSYESGFKTGYTQALSDIMLYLRHYEHYQKPVDINLLKRWHQDVKQWQRQRSKQTPPPTLDWERQGNFGK